MNSRAVIYARFSSHNQTEQSIEGQLRVCYEYAKNNQIDILGEYIDRALTGTTDKRPQFLKMIDDSKKKYFDFVLVYQLDRFARNRYDSATYKAKLKKNGVKVISARENISSDASGILVEGLLESMAEYYSVELAQKVNRGIRETLLKGNYCGGHVPLGYKIVDKKWTINEDEAEIVRKVFNDYSHGKIALEIAHDINRIFGYTTKDKNKYTVNKIARIIRNQKYIGLITTKDTVYNNVIPPIIEERIFKECNTIMDEHKHKSRTTEKEPYYLTGKLICGYCGGHITADAGSGHQGQVYRYYKCSTKRADKKSCKKKSIPKDQLEALVFNASEKYILQPKVIEEVSKIVTDTFNSELQKETTVKALKSSLSTIDYSLGKLVKAVENGVDAVSLKEDFARLEEKKNALEIKIAREEAKLTKPLHYVDVKNFITYFANKKFDDLKVKKEFFNSFINRVILYDDKMVIYYNTNEQANVNLDEDEILKIKTIKKGVEKEKNSSEFRFKRESLGCGSGI